MNINYINFSNTTRFHDTKIPYITFRSFEKLDFIRHGFSTRLGGVSKGIYESMNLNFTRGDDNEAVRRNFSLIGEALNILPDHMVFAMQTHTANVMEADYEHLGMGVTKDRSFSDIDGLVTNRPGIALVTSYADCVPIFLADPVKKAIGLSHAGWKGTVKNIAAVTVERMNKLYNSRPEDIFAFIGPSICRNCYEIGEDVAEEFAKAYSENVFDGILFPKENNKFHLDLHHANYFNLVNAGLLPEHISVTDICTCCNPEILYSHRASKGLRGGLCGFLEII